MEAYKKGLVDGVSEWGDFVAALPPVDAAEIEDILIFFATPNVMGWITGCVAYEMALELEGCGREASVITMGFCFNILETMRYDSLLDPSMLDQRCAPGEYEYKGLADLFRTLTLRQLVLVDYILEELAGRGADHALSEMAQLVRANFWRHFAAGVWRSEG